MKPQITCKLTLRSYATAVLYDEGFVIKVTRQIPQASVEDIKKAITSYPTDIFECAPEVFSLSGRWYLSVHKGYFWGSNVWPSLGCHKVQRDCEDMHCYVMSTILNWKANLIDTRLRIYTHGE